MKINLFRPFSLIMGHTTLPSNIVNKLTILTDSILENENKVDWSPKLVGVIEEQTQITKQLLVANQLDIIFDDIVKNYVYQCLGEKKLPWASYGIDDIHVEMDSMWINSQLENEYNPVHWHSSDISATLYLKMPEIKSRNIRSYNGQERDGKIVFINKAADPRRTFESPIAEHLPQVGELFLWPSHLLHAVYPFQGEGERRSVAFNYNWHSKTP